MGAGIAGTVFLAYDRDRDREFAVKEIPIYCEGQIGTATSKELQSLECDMSILQTLNHERIVQYYGCGRDDNNFYIFMEYMTGVFYFI